MLAAIGRVLRAAARFGRAREGATLVEFGLVAGPFFLLTFGMAEISMIGFAQTTLDYAVSQVARKIRTGEDQTANVSYSQIKTDLCSQLNGLMVLDCSNLFLDVNTFASFVNIQNNNPVQNGQLQTNGFGYNPGTPSSIVVVRAYYRWQVLTPFFQTVFGNLNGGQRLLVSTMMFRNEPYGG